MRLFWWFSHSVVTCSVHCGFISMVSSAALDFLKRIKSCSFIILVKVHQSRSQFASNTNVTIWVGENFSHLFFSGPLRGKMAECYHSACDSVRGPYDASFANMDFYQKTVQTILNSVVEMSKSRCLRTEHLQQFYAEEDNKAASSAGSYLGGTLMSLTEFIRRYMPWNQ